MTRPESDYTQNADGTWREKTADELRAEYEAGRGAGKSERAAEMVPRQAAAARSRTVGLMAGIMAAQAVGRTQVKIARLHTTEAPASRYELRSHCPGSMVSKQARGLPATKDDRYSYPRSVMMNGPCKGAAAEVVHCTGCGEVLSIEILEPRPPSADAFEANFRRRRDNRSKAKWRAHRRKHGKLKRGW